jgi:hypothetical protein
VALPSGGAAVLLTNSSDNTHYYLGYFDQYGTELYEKDLTSVTGYASVRRPLLGVDTLGNAVIVRTLTRTTSPYDQELYVDSFDASGTMTRLFDSEAEFGTTSKDVFTTSSQVVPVSQIIGEGKIYLPLCHETTGSPNYCTATGNPQIVVIPAPATGYPQSENLVSQASTAPQYVALGDSYASGEGNSPFITPSDSDGCDRSPIAYPTLVAPAANASLRAFVACSGATSTDVSVGYKGEPSQLDSLDPGTDMVTITVGGDDVGFSSFAAACVGATLSCDAGSSAYQDTMYDIDNYLEGFLSTLFDSIASAAPNATVYVVGYPEIVPGSGGSCPPIITGIEQSAIDTVVTSMNNKIRAATVGAGSQFEFIDATASGSPFDGHDLCSADSYFNSLSWPLQYSFHPNANGQAAYAELIANYL